MLGSRASLRPQFEAGPEPRRRLLELRSAGRLRDSAGVEPCRRVRAVCAQVDPETYAVTADGVVLTCEPARTLPLARRFFLF